MFDRNLRRTASRSVSVLAIALAGSVLVGCNAQQSRTVSYRQNPTPELDTLSQRHDDIDNRLTITNDTNLRMLNEDIGRVLMLNRPSRLSPMRIPY